MNTKPNFNIREIDENDAERFLVLRERIETESEGMIYEPGERKSTVEHITKNIKGNKETSNCGIFVAEIEKEMLGFIMIHGMEARRVNKSRSIVMGVLKSEWGKGIGKALIQHALTFAQERKLHRLGLEVWRNNPRAISLYTKNGFKEEGIRKDFGYMGGNYVDLLNMGIIFNE